MEAVSVRWYSANCIYGFHDTNMQMRTRNISYELHRFNSEMEDVEWSKYVRINSSKFRPIVPVYKLLVCQ